MLQGYVGNAVGLKSIDAVGTSIHSGSADDMVLNPTLNVLSAITCGGCNFQVDNHILLYLDVFKNFYMQEGNFRENMVEQKCYILSTYQPFLIRTTANYWWTLKVYYLLLKWRHLSMMSIFVHSEMLCLIPYCSITKLLK